MQGAHFFRELHLKPLHSETQESVSCMQDQMQMIVPLYPGAQESTAAYGRSKCRRRKTAALSNMRGKLEFNRSQNDLVTVLKSPCMFDSEN